MKLKTLLLAFAMLSTLALSCKGSESVIGNRDTASPAPLLSAPGPSGVGFVKASEFNKATALWPPSTNRWMAPGAVHSTALRFGGPGLDVGALRTGESGYLEILGVSGNVWSFFDPSDPVHIRLASGFNRYGPGWGYGPGHNLHDEVTGYFQQKYGRSPTPMEKLDIEHNKAAWESLRADVEGGLGGVTPTPLPADGVEIIGPDQGRPGESLRYTLRSECKPNRWTWTAPGAIIQGRGTSLFVTWLEAGMYPLMVRGSGGGCGSSIRKIQIGDSSVPTPTPVPVTPTPPPPTPVPTPPPASFSGIVTITEGGVTRRFALVEIE